jgi:hypothetical protein
MLKRGYGRHKTLTGIPVEETKIDTYLSSKLLLLHRSKVGHLVEVDVCQLGALEHFNREFTSAIHD